MLPLKIGESSEGKDPRVPGNHCQGIRMSQAKKNHETLLAKGPIEDFWLFWKGDIFLNKIKEYNPGLKQKSQQLLS